MAIDDNNRLFFTIGTADPETQSYTVGASASLLLVKYSAEAALDADQVNAVRWGGAGGSLLTNILYRKVAGAERRQVALWYLISPTAQTADLWFDMTAATFDFNIEAVWFTGTDLSSPIADSDADATNNTSVQTPALVPVGTDNWLETVLYSATSGDALSPQGAANETNETAAAGHRCAFSWLDNIDADVTPGWNKAGAAAVLILGAVLLKPDSGPPARKFILTKPV